MTERQDEELTVSEIQRENLEVLVRFDSLCKEHGWKYYIAFGTLLGAVRHKGFIPWDDDIDVQMFRSDFDAFVLWCEENENKIQPFKLCNRKTVTNYPFGIPRFANMEFAYVTTSRLFADFEQGGAFIDVYPLDNYCNSYDEGKKLEKKNRKNKQECYSLYGKK